jgi:hypothetical protein
MQHILERREYTVAWNRSQESTSRRLLSKNFFINDEAVTREQNHGQGENAGTPGCLDPMVTGSSVGNLSSDGSGLATCHRAGIKVI